MFRLASQVKSVVHERVGSGASLPLLYTSEGLYARAEYWRKCGYKVVWHDGGRWFLATHPTEPTVYATVHEVER